MDLQYLKGVLKYVASAILSIILIAYITYHISGGFQTGIETESAILTTQEQTLTIAATITRNEKIIYSAVDGDVNYLYGDGERVSANKTVAEVFPDSASETVHRKIIDIDRKIAILEDSNMTDAEKRVFTSSTDEQIWKHIFSLLDYSDSGRITEAFSESENLMIQLNKRLIITKVRSDYNDKIEILKKERELLSAELSAPESTVSTLYTGYFYSAIDGYEESFTPENYSSVTYSQYLDIANEKQNDYLNTGKGYPVGKVVTDYTWYLTCEISTDLLHNFETEKYYKVTFPFNNGTSINMYLMRVLADVESNTAILMFRTDIQPRDFNFSRNQTVQIVQQSFSGYRVPTSAVRIVNGMEGVYILKGSKIEFRRIAPLIEYDGYLIVKERDEDASDKGRWLAKNDFVIVKGKNIYDGKIIN